MPLPAAVQRRVDDEASAWARAFPDPDVADPVLRSAAHRFADATALVLQDRAVRRSGGSRLLATAALLLAGLAVLGLVLPIAAVPLLVAGALVCLVVALATTAVPAAPALDELRAALRAAAYRRVLARRSDASWTGRQSPGGLPHKVRLVAPGTVVPPAAERGRATYEAASHLVDRDTATVIDL